MIFFRIKTMLLVLCILLVSAFRNAVAWTNDEWKVTHGVFGGATAATVSNFGFYDQDLHINFTNSNSVSTMGGCLGYEIFRKSGTRGLGASGSFTLFTPLNLGTLKPESDYNSLEANTFSNNLKIFLYTFDLIGYLFVIPRIDLGLYGRFSLGGIRVTYELDPGDLSLSAKKDSKTYNGIIDDFGFGTRWFFYKHFSAILEARWFLMSVSDTYTAKPGNDVFYYSDHKETYAPMISIGILIN
jgi:hypothetical protein